MADKILYSNKEKLIDNESIPNKNKVTVDDMNEIKSVVNSHAIDIETLDTQKANATDIPTDLSELSNENTKFVNETQLANAVNEEKEARESADTLINNSIRDIQDNIATIFVDYGKTIELSLDTSTFVLNAILKNKNGTVLSSSNIDLPIESMIINASYDNTTKELVLTLQNGNTVRVSVADLISGLQSEITSTNKLNADLVDDSTSTNKFVTASDKTNWNAKVNDTDYAANSKAGVIKISDTYNSAVTATGYLYPKDKTYQQYLSGGTNVFISKGTLENVITGKGIVDSTKIKTVEDTTAGNVYDVTYINTMIGNLESILETLDIRKWGVVYEYSK